MIDSLYNTDQKAYTYILRAFLISFIPSIIISVILTPLFPEGGPEFQGNTLSLVISLIFVSPILETLLMWPIIKIIGLFTSKHKRTAILSALIWAIFHSLLAPIWGFVIAWPFFVFSTAFIEWKKKSTLSAICVTTLIHMCQNSIPTLILIAQPS